MRISRLSGRLLITTAITVAALCAGANAQNRRRSTPVPTPTPDVEIISRAADQTPPVYYTEPTPVPEERPANVDDLKERITKLESDRTPSYDEKQKRMLLNLDILTRAEQRVESLRKQLFEMIEKENSIKIRIDQIEFNSRPEVINREVALAGTLRPEDIRESRKKSLDSEKTNLEALLTEITTAKTDLESSLRRANDLVYKLRLKLEKDIDDALLTDDGDGRP